MSKKPVGFKISDLKYRTPSFGNSAMWELNGNSFSGKEPFFRGEGGGGVRVELYKITKMSILPKNVL